MAEGCEDCQALIKQLVAKGFLVETEGRWVLRDGSDAKILVVPNDPTLILQEANTAIEKLKRVSSER